MRLGATFLRATKGLGFGPNLIQGTPNASRMNGAGKTASGNGEIKAILERKPSGAKRQDVTEGQGETKRFST